MHARARATLAMAQQLPSCAHEARRHHHSVQFGRPLRRQQELNHGKFCENVRAGGVLITAKHPTNVRTRQNYELAEERLLY